MNNKLIVLSIDSLQTPDLEYLKSFSNFSKVLSKCALIKDVTPIYPTLTYPIHTTIITGVTPHKHGIPHNQLPSINHENPDWSIMGSDWNWYSDSMKAYSLVDAAIDKGLTTASVAWPVMAGQKPTYNLAEIWPNSKEPFLETLKRSCTENVIEDYYEEYIKELDWTHKPDSDGFNIPIAADIIKRHKPDLMLIHSVCLDHERHISGDENESVNKCLERVDGIVGTIIDACEEAGILENTNIVILGDHGHIDVKYVFNLNILFAKYGLIRIDEDGNVIDYDAYSFSAGLSTHIMLKDKTDTAMTEKVYLILKKIKDDYPEYIERLYTEEEVLLEEGLSGDFSFVLESVEGVTFSNEVVGDLIISTDSENYTGYKGMHGHHPSKGKKPPFIVYGPSIKRSVTIEGGTMLDQCPTLARLLDVEMPDMGGKEYQIFDMQ